MRVCMCVCVCAYIHNSAIKNKEIVASARTRVKLEGIMLSEKSQTET